MKNVKDNVRNSLWDPVHINVKYEVRNSVKYTVKRNAEERDLWNVERNLWNVEDLVWKTVERNVLHNIEDHTQELLYDALQEDLV